MYNEEFEINFYVSFYVSFVLECRNNFPFSLQKYTYNAISQRGIQFHSKFYIVHDICNYF